MRAPFLQSARKALIERGDSWGNLRIGPILLRAPQGVCCQEGKRQSPRDHCELFSGIRSGYWTSKSLNADEHNQSRNAMAAVESGRLKVDTK